MHEVNDSLAVLQYIFAPRTLVTSWPNLILQMDCLSDPKEKKET
jgi:hypothetical protein